MGVELNQAERPVLFHMRLQKRIGDEMVAADGQERGICRQHLPCGVGNLFRYLVGIAVVEFAIPVVDDRKRFVGIVLPGPGLGPCHVARTGAHRTRTQSRARTPRRGQIVWHSHHCDVYISEIARIAAAHEAERAGVKGLGNDPTVVVPGKGKIPLNRVDANSCCHLDLRCIGVPNRIQLGAGG